MNKLEELIDKLETKVSKQEVINETVSKSAVGWHIEHTLLVIDSVMERIKKSNPTDYDWKFNFKRLLVFTIHKMPRGKIQAPTTVQPKNDLNDKTLKEHFQVAKDNLTQLNLLTNNHYFEHKILGKLNLKTGHKIFANPHETSPKYHK